MTAHAEFYESAADPRVQSAPLSHLSVELGHFYAPDLRQSEEFFVDHFRRIGVWYSAARTAYQNVVPKGSPRISTCILIDDYFGRLDPPPVLVHKLLTAAQKAGVEIDYVARESGCADPVPVGSDPESAETGLSPADLVKARLVADPPPGTTGARPPVGDTGWLCNGMRSPETKQEAMKPATPWSPPAENATVNHSIFADIELWKDGTDGRQWSCAMLAAVWQLLRLGMLRDNGHHIAAPQPMPADLPDSWRALPMILRVNERAAPFNAYRAMTICAPLFQPVENAVRTILQQVAVDQAVMAQVTERAGKEGLSLPDEVVNRIEYLFVDTGPVRGANPR
ncbi:SCO2522 family protein [Actinoplanes subglobosus]|uniref:SCO2522 family protein n=1 Tax=Actinoplanes subglobosus TaxID=1547892 RepID=A0ABV8ILN8_9ACTN